MRISPDLGSENCPLNCIIFVLCSVLFQRVSHLDSDSSALRQRRRLVFRLAIKVKWVGARTWSFSCISSNKFWMLWYWMFDFGSWTVFIQLWIYRFWTSVSGQFPKRLKLVPHLKHCCLKGGNEIAFVQLRTKICSPKCMDKRNCHIRCYIKNHWILSL